MSKKLIAGAVVYFGLIAVCCTALYVIPSVKGMLEKTYIAEYGRIDVNDEVSAFIVRDEKVYVAEQPSIINRLAETDKLVKADTRVVELTVDEDAIAQEEAAEEAVKKAKGGAGKKKSEETEAAEEAEAADGSESASGDSEAAENADGSDDDKSSGGSSENGEKSAEDSGGGDGTESDTAPEYDNPNAGDTGKYNKIMEELGDSVITTSEGYNQGAGYVSYYVDGAEAKLSTDALESLTYKDFKKLTGKKAIEVPKEKCGRGYPVFKIVKNARWYLVYYLDNDDAEKYEAGSTVTIDINGSPVDVTVSQVLTGEKQARITLSCKSFFDGFLEIRNLETTVTVASAEGLVLEDSSIVDSPDGRRGVFVKNKLGEHVFKPIKAKADDGKKCVVFSDIYVDADGNYVETIATYDEIIAEPTEEDMAILSKQIEEEEKARAEAEAAAKAAEEAAAAEQAAALEQAQAEAAEAQAQAEAAAAEAEKKAQEAAEAQAEAEKKAQEAAEAQASSDAG